MAKWTWASRYADNSKVLWERALLKERHAHEGITSPISLRHARSPSLGVQPDVSKLVGHSHHLVPLPAQVYNLTTYPNLVGLFEELGVDTEPSEMSFALSMDDGDLEWGSHGLDTVFAQRKNCTSPTFLRMVADVVRFGRQAPKVRTAGLLGFNFDVVRDMMVTSESQTQTLAILAHCMGPMTWLEIGHRC